MRDRGRAARRGLGLALAVWLGLVLAALGLPSAVLADDCSGPSDCQAPPGNADAATGLAAAMAVLAIVLATTARRREQRRAEAERRAVGEGEQSATSYDRSSQIGTAHERREGTGFAPSRGVDQGLPGAQMPEELPTRESRPGGEIGGSRGGRGLGGPAAGEGLLAREEPDSQGREALATPNTGAPELWPEAERPTGGWRVPPEPSGDLGGSRGSSSLGRPEGSPEDVLHERRETTEWRAREEGPVRERPTDRGPSAEQPAEEGTAGERPGGGRSGSGELGGARGGHGLGRAAAESLEDAGREPPAGAREDDGAQLPPGPSEETRGQPPAGRDRAARHPEDDPGHGSRR